MMCSIINIPFAFCLVYYCMHAVYSSLLSINISFHVRKELSSVFICRQQPFMWPYQQFLNVAVMLSRTSPFPPFCRAVVIFPPVLSFLFLPFHFILRNPDLLLEMFKRPREVHLFNSLQGKWKPSASSFTCIFGEQKLTICQRLLCQAP